MKRDKDIIDWAVLVGLVAALISVALLPVVLVPNLPSWAVHGAAYFAFWFIASMAWAKLTISVLNQPRFRPLRGRGREVTPEILTSLEASALIAERAVVAARKQLAEQEVTR